MFLLKLLSNFSKLIFFKKKNPTPHWLPRTHHGVKLGGGGENPKVPGGPPFRNTSFFIKKKKPPPPLSPPPPAGGVGGGGGGGKNPSVLVVLRLESATFIWKNRIALTRMSYLLSVKFLSITSFINKILGTTRIMSCNVHNLC